MARVFFDRSSQLVNPNSFHIERIDSSRARTWITENGVPGTPSTSLMAHRSMTLDIFRGHVLRDFHRRKNQGELLPYTDFSKVIYNQTINAPVVINSGHTRLTNPSVVVNWYRRWDDGSNLPFPLGCNFTSNQRALAHKAIVDAGINLHIPVQQAASVLYSRGWDGLTFLAELHKIVRMFRQAIPRLLSLIADIGRALSRGELTSLSSNVLGHWLEGRYGWRILVFDIQDINNLIRNFDKKQRTRVKERTGFSRTHTVDDSKPLGGVFAGVRAVTDDITEYEINIRGSVIADFMPSRIRLNPVVTAWELVPFSFVLDWFVNVGQALEALSFLALSDKYTAATGIHVKMTRTFGYSSVQPADSIHWENQFHTNVGEVSVTEVTEYSERRNVAVSTLPPRRINLDGFKVMDLVALAVGSARRMLSRR